MRLDVRDIEFGRLGVALDKRADGSMIVRSTEVVAPAPQRLTERLEHWARLAPERVASATTRHWPRARCGQCFRLALQV